MANDKDCLHSVKLEEHKVTVAECMKEELAYEPAAREATTIKIIDCTAGEVIHKYSSTVVFKVESGKSWHQLGLKKIKIKSERTRRKISNEIELLKLLDEYERITNLFDYQETDSHFLLLVEYGDVNLANLMNEQQELRWNIYFIKYYWEQAVCAIDALHRNNIIHLSITPKSFMLVNGLLKLTDLGKAKKMNVIELNDNVQDMDYISPEAIASANKLFVGKRKDVWSLGIILYEMTYRKTPFDHLPPAMKKNCIYDPKHEIAFPTTTDKESIELPNKLLLVLKSCLDRNLFTRAQVSDLVNQKF